MRDEATSLAYAIEKLDRALATFKELLTIEHGESYLADAIAQRFEYTYELGWKLLQIMVAEESIQSVQLQLSRRDLFRSAANLGLIDDPISWFGYHDLRNRSTHTYFQPIAEEVRACSDAFAADIDRLLERARAYADRS